MTASSKRSFAEAKCPKAKSHSKAPVPMAEEEALVTIAAAAVATEGHAKIAAVLSGAQGGAEQAAGRAVPVRLQVTGLNKHAARLRERQHQVDLVNQALVHSKCNSSTARNRLNKGRALQENRAMAEHANVVVVAEKAAEVAVAEHRAAEQTPRLLVPRYKM
jgi:hypothetical protein